MCPQKKENRKIVNRQKEGLRKTLDAILDARRKRVRKLYEEVDGDNKTLDDKMIEKKKYFLETTGQHVPDDRSSMDTLMGKISGVSLLVKGRLEEAFLLKEEIKLINTEIDNLYEKWDDTYKRLSNL